MSKVTYFVRMIAKEGKAEEVGETLRTNCSNVQQEKGNVVFALHRSVENPDELPITRPGRARRQWTLMNRARGSKTISQSSVPGRRGDRLLQECYADRRQRLRDVAASPSRIVCGVLTARPDR